MRKINLIFVLALAFNTGISLATNPENTNWMSNISEGNGSTTSGLQDDHHQIHTVGNTIHVIWIVRSDDVKLKYRRSLDGGISWEEEKVIFSASHYSYIDPNILNRRLYADGNYVHIALVNSEGNGNTRLLYFRSTDRGKSFEPVREIFSPDYWYLGALILSGDGPYINMGVILNCSGCGGISTPYIFHSSDNGQNFSQRTLPETYEGWEYATWDMKTYENKIYFIALRPIGPWYEYEFDLVFSSSHDGGESFMNSVISTPSASGNGQPFYFMDNFWGYTAKISYDQSKVGVVWGGMNESDQKSIFTAISNDYGMNFSLTKTLVENISNLQTGFETMVINNQDVFITYNTSNSKVYWLYSVDGGENFSDEMELTQPINKSVSASWGGSLAADKVNGGAYFMSTGPLIAKLSTDVSRLKTYYYGNYSLPTRSVYGTVNSYGDLHLLFRVGNVYLWNSGWSDYDIYHKAILANVEGSTQQNMSTRFDVVALEANAEGYSQYTNLTVPLSESLMFTDQMSIEIMVKPDVDNKGETILTQYHSSTWNPWNPESTQLWLNPNNNEELLVGIMTQTGPYLLPSIRPVREGFWNQLTVTYKNDGSANNFKLYINGVLDNSMTATGQVISNSNWFLGAFKDDRESDGFDGEFDEFRLWSKELSEEEIIQNLLQPVNGSPQGLECYINFNKVNEFGQIKDMSGNLNHGFLMYNETLNESTVNPVDIGFNYTQELSTCYFTPQLTAYNSIQWDFGDGETSSLLNPSHTYNNPDSYTVCLEADHDENYGVYCDEIVIQGIDRIYPREAGNDGGLTLFVYGAGFNDNAIVSLKVEGEAVVESVKTIKSTEGDLSAVFEFDNLKIGSWDVVVSQGNSEIVHEKSLNIVQAEKAQPWVNYNGGGSILKGRWTPQTLSIGNSGNVDAYGVLLWLMIPDSPDIELEFVNLNINKPQRAIDLGIDIPELDETPGYVVLDNVLGSNITERVYSLYFAYLPANSVQTIDLRVKSETLDAFKFRSFVSPPFYRSPLNARTQACIGFGIIKAIAKVGISVIPGAACITEGIDLVSNIIYHDPPVPLATENIDVTDWKWSLFTTGVQCGVSIFIPGGTAITVAGEMVFSMVELRQESKDCYYGILPEPFGILEWIFSTLTSLDPNEKYGPTGFGPPNYIGNIDQIGYKISFENKPDATAPAHEVVITDTLDTDMLDVNNFQFGSVSFGDTIIHPGYGLTEFSYDIDLRPDKDLIVRVFGGLDSNTGVIIWKYTSLNPETMDLPFDPFGGFLPPNMVSPEGEGFVTFTVGLKDNIEHTDLISNNASIIFDTNDPIITNDHIVTFDLLPPFSSIEQPEDEEVKDTSVVLRINGFDSESGIRHYEIWISENQQPFDLFDLTIIDSFEFTGDIGTSYALYSVALDNLGNREETPLVPDVEFVLTTTVREPEIGIKEFNVYPNPTTDFLHIDILLMEKMKTRLTILDLIGREVKQIPNGLSRDKKFTSKVRTTTLEPGIYYVQLQTEERKYLRKIVVQ